MRTLGLPELLVIFGVLFLFGLALILLVAALRWKQSRSVQRALIDKVSATELAGILQTPLGEKLLLSVAESVASPGRSILTSVQRGIVAMMSGIGMLLAAAFTNAPPVVPAIAIILIFVGIGILVAAFVSYRLAKRWRLLEENGGGPAKPQAD